MNTTFRKRGFSGIAAIGLLLAFSLIGLPFATAADGDPVISGKAATSINTGTLKVTTGAADGYMPQSDSDGDMTLIDPTQNKFLSAVINPKAMSQGVQTQASTAAGYTGLSVANSAVFANTSNSFGVTILEKLPSWTTATILKQKFSGASGVKVEIVGTTGAIKLTINATTYTSAIPGGGAASTLAANTEHQIDIDISVGASNTTVTFYLDGVLLSSPAAQANSAISNSDILYLMGGAATEQYAGTTKNLIIWNRSRTAAEVLSLYRNGIDQSDKWGSQTELCPNGDMGAVGSWVEGTGWAVTGGKGVATNVGVGQQLYQSIAGLTVGRYYTVTGQVTDYTSGSVEMYFGVGTTVSNRLTSTGVMEVRAPATSTTMIVSFIVRSAATSLSVDNASLRATGATLALEPEGIQTDKWYNSSSNALNATYPASGSSLVIPARNVFGGELTFNSPSHVYKFRGQTVDSDTTGAALIDSISGGDILKWKAGATKIFHGDSTTTHHVFQYGNTGFGTSSPKAPIQYSTMQGIGVAGAGAASWSENIYSSSGYKYLTTNPASLILQYNGEVDISTAGSGSADSAATLTSRFKIGNTGLVNIANATITAGTDPGLTIVSTGHLNRQLYKVTVGTAAFSSAEISKEVVIATLPAKTVIVACYSETTVNYTGGTITTAALKVGINSSTKDHIMASHDVKTAAVTKGTADGDLGGSMNRANTVQAGYMPAWGSNTDILATLTVNGGSTTSELQTGSTTFYIVTERL